MLQSQTQTHRKVHFCGIGGIAMSATARLALELGCEVRGSDNPLYPPASEIVAALRVHVANAYDPSNLDWKPDVVVVGNALSRGNPEVEAILERRIPYVSMPEWIKQCVLQRRRPIVISGTHGKTTTTALTAFVLDHAQLNPGFLIGGQALDFVHPAKLGDEGAPFVIEGDEYDSAFFDKRAKFFHYLPEIAVVTSIEFDHGDIYSDIHSIEQAFRGMLRQIPRTGKLILCADSSRAVNLASHAYCGVVTYGLKNNADYEGEVIITPRERPRLILKKQRSHFGTFELPFWGNHNASNALAAIAVADQLGVPCGTIQEALKSFHGVKRRMEVFLECRGAVFVDDFAHHPTAIRETIHAARQRWPLHRIRAVCEPRSNTMVTSKFQQDLTDAFSDADEVWFGPVYRAEKIPVEQRLDRAKVCEALSHVGKQAFFEDDIPELARRVWETLRKDDVVLIFSNGAFGNIYEIFCNLAGIPRKHIHT